MNHLVVFICIVFIAKCSPIIAGGFTKSGHPLIILPDSYLFFEVVESDLHLVLKYFISIIPMAKQVRSEGTHNNDPFLLSLQSPGFALVIDRRNETWQEAQSVLGKIISIFPAKIKEVFLIYQYTSGQE